MSVDPSDPVLLNNLGNVYRALGSYAKDFSRIRTPSR